MKKGFTLIELLGVIVILGIVSSLAVIAVTSITNRAKLGVYKTLEANLETGTRNYLIECMEGNLKNSAGNKITDCKRPKIGSPASITYYDLLETRLISKLEDPNGGNCNSSYVLTTRKADVQNNMDINYKVCLVCTNYKSKNC